MKILHFIILLLITNSIDASINFPKVVEDVDVLIDDYPILAYSKEDEKNSGFKTTKKSKDNLSKISIMQAERACQYHSYDRAHDFKIKKNNGKRKVALINDNFEINIIKQKTKVLVFNMLLFLGGKDYTNKTKYSNEFVNDLVIRNYGVFSELKCIREMNDKEKDVFTSQYYSKFRASIGDQKFLNSEELDILTKINSGKLNDQTYPELKCEEHINKAFFPFGITDKEKETLCNLPTKSLLEGFIEKTSKDIFVFIKLREFFTSDELERYIPRVDDITTFFKSLEFKMADDSKSFFILDKEYAIHKLQILSKVLKSDIILNEDIVQSALLLEEEKIDDIIYVLQKMPSEIIKIISAEEFKYVVDFTADHILIIKEIKSNMKIYEDKSDLKLVLKLASQLTSDQLPIYKEIHSDLKIYEDNENAEFAVKLASQLTSDQLPIYKEIHSDLKIYENNKNAEFAVKLASQLTSEQLPIYKEIHSDLKIYENNKNAEFAVKLASQLTSDQLPIYKEIHSDLKIYEDNENAEFAVKLASQLTLDQLSKYKELFNKFLNVETAFNKLEI